MGSIPGSGKYPGEGNGNPLQYSCLENPTDRGAWRATVHGVAKSQTRLSDFTFNTLLSPDLLIWHAFHYGHQTVEGVSDSFHLCSVFHYYHTHLPSQPRKFSSSPAAITTSFGIFVWLLKKKKKNTPFRISMVVQWIRILPAHAGDIGLILGPGKFHMPWSN